MEIPDPAPRPMSASPGSVVPRFNIAVPVCAAAALLVGASALAGWITGEEALKGALFGSITVKANTSICFLLAGLSLLLLASDRPSPARRLIGRFFAIVVGLVGILTLSEHLVGWNLGIDELLFREAPGAVATQSPNRMGIPASLCFPFIGASLFLLGAPRPRRAAWQVPAILVMVIAFLPIIGYVLRSPELYGVARITGIALNTAIAFFLLGLGILLARPRVGVVGRVLADDHGGLLIRRLLPAAIFLPIGLGLLRILAEEAGLLDVDLGRSVLILAFIIVFTSVVLWTGGVVGRQAARVAEARGAEEEVRVELAGVAAEARANAEKYRTLADAMPALVWAADSEQRPVFVNPAWIHYTGISFENLKSSGWQDFNHPEDVPQLMELWADAARRRKSFEAEFRYRRHDGSYRWFLGRSVPLMDESGRITQWLGVCFDISKRKEAEEALRRADRLKDEFLATLAHELRNPLAPIRNAVEILKTREQLDSQSKWAREVIQRQVDHMARLLDDLLDVSRVTRNRLELRKQRVSIAAVVTHSLETSRPLVEACGHHLSVSLPEADLWIDADPLRLAQAISNLVNNAAKYTRRGGRITLAVRREGSDMILSVKDSGIGIPPEQISRIFDIFAQAAPALERSQGGLGIGLSLVRGIVEAHGGHIEARSEGSDRGSEFVIRLPAALSAAPGSAVPSPSGPFPEPPLPLRILVADDNEDGLESLTMMLRFAGHDVYPAVDGQEAVEVARRVQPDVALLDIGMPRLNGYDAARVIRAEIVARPPALVALTGWGQEEDRQRAAAAGFDHHLVKPVDWTVLSTLLSEISSERGAGAPRRGDRSAPGPP